MPEARVDNAVRSAPEFGSPGMQQLTRDATACSSSNAIMAEVTSQRANMITACRGFDCGLIGTGTNGFASEYVMPAV